MQAVVLDGYTLNPGDLSWDKLEKLCKTTIYDRTAYNLSGLDEIVQRAMGADVIFTNKTPLPAEALAKLPNLKYIGVLATGYNVVDVKAAAERGIVVTNIPTYGTESVSQMAIALLLELCHHIGLHDEAVKKGEWSRNQDWCFWKSPLVELSGKTMGIIGLGRIGRATARIAQALGMKIAAFDSYQDKTLECASLHYTTLDELFAESDVIVLHCPLFEDTKGIINKQNIAKMKTGVRIINNSRGPLIIEEDLAAALNNGEVSGAALDVVSTEPIQEDNPLLRAKNCILTPHISWAPVEARQRLLDIAIDNLQKYIEGSPINVVNK
jgi:glycerate dehydrogenase